MDKLAAAANCSNSTIRDFEAHRREPHRNRLAAIRQALELAGIVFSTADNGTMATVAGPLKPTEATAASAEKIKPPGRASRPGGTKRKVRNRAA
jgi:hypothetical protein